jgi:hypothetical protein
MVRSRALAEFAGMGPNARSAVPAIVGALDDPKVSIRLQAATTLIQINVQMAKRKAISWLLLVLALVCLGGGLFFRGVA